MALYEYRDEYCRAKHALDNVEMKMAQYFDTVNYFMKKVKRWRPEMASENETIADIVAYIRKCLDLLDTELTRKSNKEKPTMSAEALLCPVLNAKAALDRIEAAAKREQDEMLDALVRIGNWCAQDLAENAFTADTSCNYLKTLNGLCEVCRPFMQKASRLKRYGGEE